MRFIIQIDIITFTLSDISIIIYKIFRYANAPSSVTDSSSMPIPPPPIKHAKKTSDKENSNSIMKCPICRAKRKNETLVPSSGYVFCYKCIVSHLRSGEDEGSCPVTGLPVREADLIRLFPPGSE